MQELLVKENASWRAPLSWRWVCAALAASALALAGVARIDHALPDPLTRASAPPGRFVAEIAYEHLLNLTSIGPRVAGSYENEVSAVRVLVEAVREIARVASPHNRVELELHSASGAFPLDFLDGMNNVYRGVQMVVVRVSGLGGRAGGHRSALLLNCHFDTVPDSPGASDDGAGCAVLLETLRVLAVRPQPLRRDLILLLNGAEENILQASHGFVTTHRWASSVRAFLNIEACGAGGREVLFQAGPHDPWIMEVYAGAVPHPFASSLAQELFQSGLIPADTDYRIFRDFGNLSGVDLAWSANGYVYHTHLDTAENVPLPALQRTGDNVLALTQGLLQSEDLDSEVDRSSRQPVFFDVLGLVVVSARAPVALLAATLTIGIVILDVHLSALAAKRELYVRSGWWWWRAVLAALGGLVRAQAAGVLAAAAVALLLHALGARLSFYARGWLLAPLYAAPALAAAWWSAARSAGGWALRGWRGAVAWRQAGALGAAGALAACAAAGLRSGFLPLLWALGPAAAGAACGAARVPRGGWAAACGALGAALPALQTWYLALGSLRMFVPVLGRAGTGPVPADVIMAVLVSSLVLTACSWILPLVVVARNQQKLVWALAGACAAACLAVLAAPPSAAYSASRPQRLMVFHVRRSVHAPGGGVVSEEQFFWVPELDVNTGRTLRAAAGRGRDVRAVAAEECERWPYCGVPYYLPVLSLIPGSYRVSAGADEAPPATLRVRAHCSRLNDTTQLLQLNVTGPSHVVVIVSPVAGAAVSWSSAVASPRACRRPPGAGAARDRDTYFFTLHEARGVHEAAQWQVSLHLRHGFGAAGSARWADVSVAGHTLFGEHKLRGAHRELVGRLPEWVAATGWPVHQQLHRV